MKSVITIIEKITSNVLIALYQPFCFAVISSVLVLFFYMFCYDPKGVGKGWKVAVKAWIRKFKEEKFFRKLFLLVFFTIMILFRTLLNRDLWANPLSKVMGGWWIWEVGSDGSKTLTTECFENIVLMFPFTLLLMWTMKEKIVKKICFWSIVKKSTQVAFMFSLTIEFLQLFLRLGTFQFSDIFYNTLGGCLGGIVYWIGSMVHRTLNKHY